MRYKSDTIATIVSKRLNQSHFLPAIQREFVWTPQQISTLFDSLMRDYPIGSFLFWELEPENHEEWESYKFIENASQRGNHNELANTDIVQQLTLVLDGQQRLTALNIGLRGLGFYETKKPRAHWRKESSWLKRRLYLDLLQDPRVQEEDGEEGMRYGFAFLADARDRDGFSSGGRYWFKVGRILKAPSTYNLEDLIEQEQKKLPEGTTEEQRKPLRHNLTRLHKVVWENDAIWHHTEHEQDYDRVLDIFVRANSGGTTLSKSDLLLSTITARWKDVNARQEIYGFVDWINGELTRKNNFSKDFVMKTCLVLCDLPVRYRVQNFNNKNLSLIFERWEGIKDAIEYGVSLANHFGFDRDTLLSQNALIPIIYYLHTLGKGADLRGYTHFEAKNAAEIRKWLTAAMLNNAFGGASDTVLRGTWRVIREQYDGGERDFPVEHLNRRIASLGRSTEFDNTLIEEVLSLPYGNRRTFLALTLLYDRKDWGVTGFHQDHIFPRSRFTDQWLEAAGVPSEKWWYYRELCNQLGNLELLLPDENMEKSAKDFSEWVKTRDPSFRQEHLIPKNDNLLTLECFEEFIAAREDLIRERLRKLFQIDPAGETDA